MESRETRGMVSRQFNLIQIQLEYLQMSKNKPFIAILGVTARSFRSTVTMKRSIVDRFNKVAIVGLKMERQDDPINKCYKNA